MNMATRYAQAHGGNLDVGFMDEVNQYIQANPLKTPQGLVPGPQQHTPGPYDAQATDFTKDPTAAQQYLKDRERRTNTPAPFEANFNPNDDAKTTRAKIAAIEDPAARAELMRRFDEGTLFDVKPNMPAPSAQAPDQVRAGKQIISKTDPGWLAGRKILEISDAKERNALLRQYLTGALFGEAPKAQRPELTADGKIHEGKLQKGEVYETHRGPAIWDGTQFDDGQ
jgi:hypothetical protein